MPVSEITFICDIWSILHGHNGSKVYEIARKSLKVENMVNICLTLDQEKALKT